jgi:predicted Zn-dependent protease with MMP-like domain
MAKLTPLQFENLVVDALATLPRYFQQRLQNVEILIADWPSRYDLDEAGLEPGDLLLGLYRGIPLTERTSGYNLVVPDTITLYRGAIEMAAGHDPVKLREEVRHTVVHEIAHHFGIDDDRLRQLGAY